MPQPALDRVCNKGCARVTPQKRGSILLQFITMSSSGFPQFHFNFTHLKYAFPVPAIMCPCLDYCRSANPSFLRIDAVVATSALRAFL